MHLLRKASFRVVNPTRGIRFDVSDKVRDLASKAKIEVLDPAFKAPPSTGPASGVPATAAATPPAGKK